VSVIDPSKLRVSPGRAISLGAVVRPTGVRFSVISRHATALYLALFDRPEDTKPVIEFAFDPELHRIGDMWSIFVSGLEPGTLYALRAEGPFEPEKGHRFDATRYLLAPYARCIVGDVRGGTAKCRVVSTDFDWIDDVRPRIPMGETIIYEAHVRGFTFHESSGVAHGGTYRGLIEKIPYLKDLGVTMVELMPIQEVGEVELDRVNPATGEVLHNYWGYNPIGFFAPSGRYACDGMGGQVEEFREMVAALHRAGIEVSLDVVFNHTAEGNEKGPTLCFKGLDNAIYYLLDGNGGYIDFSGCGNTLNCNHPLVRDFILDCLRYWVTVFHVDGFRFDLASILGRDRSGDIVPNAPLIERIAEDAILRDVKLIAEAWDAGGGYQVGSFGDVRWAEWNGKYRDEVRRFWRGDAATKAAFATRVTGSADLYQDDGRTPPHSINFVTAHDGFTLRDLVSYNNKHNEANGENNKDGMDGNFSWNCGIEGETDDAAVNALRLRMQKNFLATLFLSLGTPMLLGGDEFGRTQQGNNNAYCQDNTISWYDWTLLTNNADLFRFCKEIIRFRKENPVFSRATYFTGKATTSGKKPDVVWHTRKGKLQQWDDGDRCLAYWINGAENGGTALYLMFNPSPKPARFSLPRGWWVRRIDTTQPSPHDVVPQQEAPMIERAERVTRVSVTEHGLVVLAALDQA